MATRKKSIKAGSGEAQNTAQTPSGKAHAAFVKEISAGYAVNGAAIALGAAMLGESASGDLPVRIPLATLNRHGLISGATGTGKTRTLQALAEELSREGVPSLLMDLKGDLSGLAAPGERGEAITRRHHAIGIPFAPCAFPVELMSLSDEPGLRLRATVLEFGPLLLARLLQLNDTQTGILAVIFKFCDDNGLLLLDLKDLKKAVHFAANEGKDALAEEYGKISASSAGIILRKVAALEQEGAEAFFGERSFDPTDLLRTDEEGRGVISIVRLTDLQNRPALFSTFMLQILAEIFEKFPEQGDSDRPKLVLFVDEAHLVFKEASKALLAQIEMIVKLIRSRGVGVFFSTQNPDDVPAPVLSQLGLKVQHALRAFTARDRKAITRAAENFPDSPFYKTDTLLTELGIGEALVTALNEKGRPTPLVRTMLRAPASRMGVLEPDELLRLSSASKLAPAYAATIDRESAYELLSEKAAAASQKPAGETAGTGRKADKGTVLEAIVESQLARQVGRTVAREVVRGVLGVIGLSGKGRRKWF